LFLKKTNQTVAKTGKNFVLAKFEVVTTNSQIAPTRKSNAMQYQLDGKKGVIIDQKQRCSKFHKWKAQKTHNLSAGSRFLTCVSRAFFLAFHSSSSSSSNTWVVEFLHTKEPHLPSKSMKW
jgi:hypothetical protein